MSETTPTGDSIDQIRREAETCWTCGQERRQREPRALCPAHARRLRVVEEAETPAAATTERPALPTAAEVREVAARVSEMRTRFPPPAIAPADSLECARQNQLGAIRAALNEARRLIDSAEKRVQLIHQQASTD